MTPGVTHLFADGGVVGVNPSPHAGTWGWCHTTGFDGPYASAQRVLEDFGYFTPALFGGPAVTNNVSELYAVLLGLEALPDGWSGTVCSDSSITMGRLRTWTLPPGVAHALRNVPAALQLQVWRQTQRLDWPRIEWVVLKGHPTREQLKNGRGSHGLPVSSHNVWADTLTRLGAERYGEDATRAQRLSLGATSAARVVKRSRSVLADLCRAARPLPTGGTTGTSAKPTDTTASSLLPTAERGRP